VGARRNSRDLSSRWKLGGSRWAVKHVTKHPLFVVRDHAFVRKQFHVKSRNDAIELLKSFDRDCQLKTSRPFYPNESQFCAFKIPRHPARAQIDVSAMRLCN
jgi:hypothetical protein